MRVFRTQAAPPHTPGVFWIQLAVRRSLDAIAPPFLRSPSAGLNIKQFYQAYRFAANQEEERVVCQKDIRCHGTFGVSSSFPLSGDRDIAVGVPGLISSQCVGPTAA